MRMCSIASGSSGNCIYAVSYTHLDVYKRQVPALERKRSGHFTDIPECWGLGRS